MTELLTHRDGRRFGRNYRHAVRRIVAAERDGTTDAQLGLVLTFVAGAVNAGGFFYVGQYTSHMSGIVAAIADHVVLGLGSLVMIGIGALAAFTFGAAVSAILINWGRRHYVSTQYVLPIALESALLLVFGVLVGPTLPTALIQPLAIPLLCFIMGLQNATVTKISGARIRTTHVTGMVTDFGIEIGKFAYELVLRFRGASDGPTIAADRPKLALLASLLGAFVAGGITGALGFSRIGPVFAVVMALVLAALVAPSLGDIVRHRRLLARRRQRRLHRD